MKDLCGLSEESGCVVFDHFVIDERKSFDSQCLILTSRIPRYITWAVSITHAKKNLKDWL